MQKNFTLTKEEQKEIERRGFLVKNRTSMLDLLRDFLVFISIFLAIILYIFFSINEHIVYMNWMSMIGWKVYLFFATIPALIYALSDKIFYNKQSIIGYGVLSSNNKFISYLDDIKVKFFTKIINLFIYPIGKNGILGQAFRQKSGSHSGRGLVILMIFPVVYIIGGLMVWGDFLGRNIIGIDSLWWQNLICALVSFGIIIPYKYIIEYFLGIIHPLYAFGNLGEKIQNLTPEIEKKSREIRENFQKDMNFHILSEGFDSLSNIFSEIISLVIKLERVEKRANKGNLFDSVKYIDSLRSDIVEPLKQLRKFLEKQKVQLEHSQEELQKVRVRVGGPLNSGFMSEGQAQSELSSKRSTPLISELTESIEKLDVMIERLG